MAQLYFYVIGLSGSSASVTIDDPSNESVEELRFKIWKKKPNDLGQLDPDQLILYRVKLPNDAKSLRELTRPEDVEGAVELSNSSEKLSTCFQDMNNTMVRVLVQLHNNLVLALNDAKNLHRKYWGAEQDLVQSMRVQRDEEPIPFVVPLLARQLEAHDFFPNGRAILIRDEYEDVIAAIEAHFNTAQHGSFLICGHPGIGKSLLLYYILCRRLKARQTTIIQPNEKRAFLFTSGGAIVIDPTSDVDLSGAAPKGTWYLFDASEDSARPSPTFYRERPTGLAWFSIVAASTRNKYKGDWMKRGVGEHLYDLAAVPYVHISRNLQEVVHSERSIHRFYERFGKSARLCYQYAGDHSMMESRIQNALLKTDWSTAKKMLRGGSEIDPDGESHLLFVVIPCSPPKTFEVCLATSYLKSELQVGVASRQGGFLDELFSAAFDHNESKGLAGKLLETKSHFRLPEGGKWKLSSMIGRKNTSSEPKWITYLPGDGEPGTLTLSPKEVQWFSIVETDLDLTSNTYYRPYNPSHPSFDAFVFNTAEDTFVVFQVSVSENRDVKPRGLQFLLDLLRHHKKNKQLDASSLKIRLIAVVNTGTSPEVKIPTSSSWRSIQWDMKFLQLETHKSVTLSHGLEKERLDDIDPFFSATADKKMAREDVCMEVD